MKKEGAAKRKREAAERAAANAAKRNKPFDAETWEPERNWPVKGEAFIPCSYDGIVCACSKRTKAAHLKSDEHVAWLARIRPLEQEKQAPRAQLPPAVEESEDSDSGSSSDCSNDSAAPVRNPEGFDAVIDALLARDEPADSDGIYSHRTDAHVALEAEAAKRDDIDARADDGGADDGDDDGSDDDD